MRILFIAQGDSPHTTRTLLNTRNYYPDAAFDVFRSSPFAYSSDLSFMATCHDNGSPLPSPGNLYWNELFINPVTPWSASPSMLANLLRRESYDFIHVLAMQEGAYLLRKALEEPGVSVKNAKVLFSLWGNDLYYFSRIPGHNEEIRKALPLCDRLHADAERDVELARGMGYAKEILPSISAIASAEILRQIVRNNFSNRSRPTQRKRIIMRGTYPVRGRGFMGLAAYQTLPVSLKKAFQVILLVPDCIDIATAYTLTDCQPVAAMKQWQHPNVVLQIMSESRAVVSLNITDGTPQMYWEAASTGCYPIFSKDTGLASLTQKVGNGSNIALVDPNDVRSIAAALEQILTDDALVDAAAACNEAVLNQTQSRENMATLFNAMYNS